MSEVPKLTTRELALASLIASGLTNKAIAMNQKVAYGTIVNQREKLYKKLKVHCTADFIRVATKANIITI